MNVADSEVVAAIMEMAGYTISDKIDDADAVLLNACSIRDNAEQKIVSRLQALGAERRKRGRLIIGVIGCMAERVQQALVGNHGVDIVAGAGPATEVAASFSHLAPPATGSVLCVRRPSACRRREARLALLL